MTDAERTQAVIARLRGDRWFYFTEYAAQFPYWHWDGQKGAWYDPHGNYGGPSKLSLDGVIHELRAKEIDYAP